MSLNALQNLLELPFAKANEPLSKHTTMKVGGPARVWVEPNTAEELTHFLQLNTKLGVPLYVLGEGSNIVAGENGFEGVVLHLGKSFNWSRAESNLLVAGGAAYLPKLTKFSIENQLGNFEWACGIPGSLGGSLWGNAGARGFNGHEFESRDCAADFYSCVAFDRSGNRVELGKNDVQFGYRKTSLDELIVVEATFALKPLSVEAAKTHKEAVRGLLEKRRQTQPANAASAGCIWKNPKGEGLLGAGALVEKYGLKGIEINGAKVSEIHGNFVINTGGAYSQDVLELVELVEAKIKRETGIELEREARFL